MSVSGHKLGVAVCLGLLFVKQKGVADAGQRGRRPRTDRRLSTSAARGSLSSLRARRTARTRRALFKGARAAAGTVACRASRGAKIAVKADSMGISREFELILGLQSSLSSVISRRE